MNKVWLKITELEFEELKKNAVKRHTIMFCDPPVTFYWDEDGAKHEDLSFGQYAYLKNTREMTIGDQIFPIEYYKIK